MRAVPIPDDEAEAIPGERTVIAPPGGDFTRTDILACEAMIDTVWDEGEIVERTFSMRIIPEGDDIDRLLRGDPFWLTIHALRLPPFSLGFVYRVVDSTYCKNCKAPLSVDVTGIAFHQSAVRAEWEGCDRPEPEVLELDPPRKPVILTEAQEEALDVLVSHAMGATGNQRVMEAVATLQEKDGHP